MLTVEYTVLDGEILAESTLSNHCDYLLDPLGSVVGRIDSTQTISEPREFWPYGQLASGTAPAIGALTFVGSKGYMVDHAGFYVRLRVYQPGNGLWASMDPIWPIELPYTYVRGKTTFTVDPLGLQERNEQCKEIYDACKNRAWTVFGLALGVAATLLYAAATGICGIWCIVTGVFTLGAGCIACIAAAVIVSAIIIAMMIGGLAANLQQCEDEYYLCRIVGASNVSKCKNDPYYKCVAKCSKKCREDLNPTRCFADCKKSCKGAKP